MLTEGNFIDVHSNDSWFVALVLHRDPEKKTVRIRYDGYSDKWDLTLSEHSARLAPFRRFSTLYTGQKSPFVHRKWVFCKEELCTTTQLLQDLGTNDPSETTQFLRGRLFTLIDNLLTYNYCAPSDRAEALEFFTEVVRFIVKWLQEAPQLLEHYKRGLANNELFLSEDSVAVAMAWPELLFTLHRLFGQDYRTSKFFEGTDAAPATLLNSKFVVGRRNEKTALRVLLHGFAEAGGFTVLLQLLELHRDQVPLQLVAAFPVYQVGGYLQKEFSFEWIRKFKELILSKIEAIDDAELRDLDKEVVTGVLVSLKVLLKEVDRDFDAIELSENIALDLAYKGLKCPYMEKKLKSLNEIREVIDKVGTSYYMSRYNPHNRLLSSNRLVQWLLDKGVVETIMEQSHAEMIKRVPDILIFLVKCSSLPLSHLELLWNSTREKHASLVIVTYQTLLDVVSVLTPEHTLFLISKFREIPLHSYNDKFIRFLKDFIAKATDRAYKHGEEAPDFGVETFYSLMQENIGVEYQNLAVDCLEEVLRLPGSCKKLWKVLELCMDNVQQGLITLQSLRTIQAIMQIVMQQRAFTLVRDTEIGLLRRKTEGIVNLAVENTKKYMADAREAAGGVQHPYKSSLVGKFAHSVNLKTRFSFLKYVLSGNGYSLSTAQFTDLWQLFVLSPVTAKDSSLFFKWFNEIFQEIFYRNATIGAFGTFFCNSTNFEPRKISVSAYKSFSKMFLVANTYEKNIEMKTQRVFCRKGTDIIGMNTLFAILIHCQDKRVESKIMRLLVKLNIKLCKNLTEFQRVIWKEFVGKCLEIIEKNRESPEVVSRVLKLLVSYLENSCLNKPSKLGNSILWHFKTQDEPKYNEVVQYYNQPLGFLRKSVAEFYQRDLDTVALIINGERYDSHDDDTPLSSFKTTISIVDFHRPYTQLTPKDFLATHSGLQDSLFQLLSQPEMPAADLAWRILTTLPISGRMVHQLQDCSRPFEQLLDTHSVYKLLYSLMIIKDLSRSPEWIKKFELHGGVDYLITVFSNVKCEVRSLTTLFYTNLIQVLEELLIPLKHPLTDELLAKLLQSMTEVAEKCKEEDEETPASAALSCKALILHSLQYRRGPVARVVLGFQEFPTLIKASLLDCENKCFSSLIVKLFLELSVALPEFGEFCLDEMIKVVDYGLLSKYKGESYWTLLGHLVKESPPTERTGQLIEKLLHNLRGRSPEKHSTDVDYVLCQILSILASSIQESSVTEELLHFVLQDCLFEIPSSTNTPEYSPICKSTSSRREAFNFLKILCSGLAQVSQLVQSLSSLHEETYWRTSKWDDWNVSTAPNQKSATGFVGLLNLGCTCYVNSSLQQLYHIPTFREGILAADNKSEVPAEDNLLVQLQKTLYALKNSDKEYINPKDFCHAIKDPDGGPVNVREQMDIDEFFNNLMDRLAEQLDGHSSALVKSHFGGLQVTECLGKDSCTHRSERDEPFISLSLQVKNKRDLFESLENFVEGDLLEGHNAYQCDGCAQKVTALRRVCIKHLPNILVICLKRFEFDFDLMRRLKVNDYYEFPFELDMEPFTQEGLQRKELLRQKEVALSNNQLFDQEIPSKRHPDDYYQYDLTGIVIHIGTAESGHYYSIIKDSKQWYEFNDTNVRPFNVTDVANEAFGGQERTWPGVSALREKFKNAYLLFYERKQVYSPRTGGEDSLAVLAPCTSSVKAKEFSEILRENEKFWRSKSCFSSEYFEFVLHLTRYSSEEVLKFVVGFYLTILIRTRDFSKIARLTEYIKQQLRLFPTTCEWLLEVVSVPATLQELLLDCPELVKRKTVVGMAHVALWNCPREALRPFLLKLLNKLQYAKKTYSLNFTQYFELVYLTVQLSPELITVTALNYKLLSHALEDNPIYTQYPSEFKFTDAFLGNDREPIGAPEPKREDFLSRPENFSFSYLLACVQSGFNLLDEVDTAWLLRESSMSVLFTGYLNKAGLQALGEIYSSVSRDSKENTMKCIVFLVKQIDSTDFDKHKPYYRVLSWLLKSQDSLAHYRLDFTLRLFITMVFRNKNYYYSTEGSLHYFMKLLLRIPLAHTWALHKRQDLRWIDSWLKDHILVLGQPGRYLHVSLYKFRQHSEVNYHSTISANCTKIYKKLQYLLSRSNHDTTEYWDSDNELPLDYVRPGINVAVWDAFACKMSRCTVLSVLDGMLQVKDDATDSQQWIDKSSEYIMLTSYSP